MNAFSCTSVGGIISQSTEISQMKFNPLPAHAETEQVFCMHNFVLWLFSLHDARHFR